MNKASVDDNVSATVKGRLKNNYNYWRHIGANNKIVEVIREGYKLPFIETPEQANFINNKTALNSSEFVTKTIQDLLARGSILETLQKPKVVNPLSVSTNSSGKKRLILDLRYINSHLYRDYTKFDDWKSVENYIEKESFTYKFDLKQGYHHVDIFSEHQTYLGFSWVINGTERFFIFTVLPFGLATAPYIFTKVMRPLVSFWHSKGIKISVYLDDGAGFENSYKKCKENSYFVKNSLYQAGFLENIEKSSWEPSKILTWLGFTLNCNNNSIQVTEDRISSIILLVQSLLNSCYTSSRNLARFIGKVISTKYILGDVVNLKTRALYKIIEGRSSWDAKLNILNFDDAHKELLYWRDSIIKLNYRVVKENEPFSVSVYSDASDKGIGAFIKDTDYICHRNFTKLESNKSSTFRELIAVSYSIESFSFYLKNKSVVWHTDNYAITRIIPKGSNKEELQNTALQIYNICNQFNIKLRVVWIPRAFNNKADQMSRYIDQDDWQITKLLFDHVNRKWGPLTIDRFANNENAKLKRFNSKFSCPDTEAMDAFTQDWKNENNLLVPPVKDIIKVIRKINQGNVQGVLIIPFWQSATFWPLLMNGEKFKSFIAEYEILSNVTNSLLQAGKCNFSLLGLKKYTGNIIVLRIKSN